MDASQVSVAITGAISKISEETVITSANTDVSGEGTVNYGFISDDGISITTDTSTNNIVAWQNSAVVRVATTEASTSYEFTLLQNSKESRELYYGATEVAGKILYKPSQMTRGRFVIDYVDTAYGANGEILIGRHVLNRAQITSRGDIVLQNGEPVGYTVTLQAFPDEDGVCAEIYHQTGAGEVVEPAAFEGGEY